MECHRLICKSDDDIDNNFISESLNIPFSSAEGTRKTAYRSRYDFLLPGVDDIRIRSFLRLPAVRLTPFRNLQSFVLTFEYPKNTLSWQ